MKIIFKDSHGNDRPTEVKILKETKKYITVQLLSGYYTKYRYNKETGEIQDNTYHKVIKGLRAEL